MREVIWAGLAGGIAGGMVMAAFSMIALWVVGSGFWTPLNLIAHTFWRTAPLDGTFSAGALVIGVAVHMTMAILVGTLRSSHGLVLLQHIIAGRLDAAVTQAVSKADPEDGRGGSSSAIAL